MLPTYTFSTTIGEALGTAEARSIMEYGIENGRGGCYLSLTPAQYRKLR
jgi:hypothetical protein